MGCNTSQEAAQKVEDEKKESSDAKKAEGNHLGTNEGKKLIYFIFTETNKTPFKLLILYEL